jgi:hypothetical protein
MNAIIFAKSGQLLLMQWTVITETIEGMKNNKRGLTFSIYCAFDSWLCGSNNVENKKL